MDFTGIESVHFGSADMALSRRFFSDWGLTKISHSAKLLSFQTGNGAEVVVRDQHSALLAPALSEGAQFREFVLGVKTQRELDRLANDLARDRSVTVDGDGVAHSVDDSGIHFGLRLNRRKATKPPTVVPRNAPGQRLRVDRVSAKYDGAQPWQMGHIVFFVPDTGEAERFYRQRLGFHLSDRYVGGAGVFLRWAQRSEHHNLFLLKSPTGKSALHHLAFEVRDQHEVFGGGLAFSKRGWPTQVGPGRHPISSAYFWYFQNPMGGGIEYFCDPDFVTEKWKPHQYRVNRFSEWHLPQGIVQIDDGKMRPSLATVKAMNHAKSALKE
jgi:catechol 2,3-dioxygenase-like lactoylglutathione lyase family enzyme